MDDDLYMDYDYGDVYMEDDNYELWDEDDLKKRYDELVKHLDQYITTPIKDFPSLKSGIIDMLKGYRPIKKGDYQYGISKAGKKKYQLIVHEFGNRSLVREYFKDGRNDWHCCECVRIDGVHDTYHYLLIKHGILFVSRFEQDCEPRNLSFVMGIQKLYKDGKKNEAAALQKSILGSVDFNTLFPFEKPAPSMLQEICSKLNVQYDNKAMQLWYKTKFEHVDTEFYPADYYLETHEFETENFYAILSKLFTGKSKHHEQIKETILEAFRNKVVELGEMSARKFNKHYWNDIVTDRHLFFIAKFLRCRILLFDGEIKKYGKWKDTSRKRVTLVLSLSEGSYSILRNF